MLSRLYVDNYKCLVNFELQFKHMNLLLGPNGAGKTTTFEVLRKLQTLLNGNESIKDLFNPASLTRWQTLSEQTFELEIQANAGIYVYRLVIEHEKTRPLLRIAHESLHFNDKPLLKFERGEAQLYRDGGVLGPTYPFDWERSVVATLPPRHDNTQLTWFRERMKRFVIVQIDAFCLENESDEESALLTYRAENFVSWYRIFSQDQGKSFELTQALREIIDGFSHFAFQSVGETTRILTVHFKKGGETIKYQLKELSEGQKTLIVLYVLAYFSRSADYTLCIDEPENFLALPEIQPWLRYLYDACAENDLQALLISHHPELIDYLAAHAGIWFQRDNTGPVRVRPVVSHNSLDGVPISTLVERGWINV